MMNIIDVCSMMENCPFIKKYQGEYNIACQGIISLYCTGHKAKDCKRKEYALENDAMPPDNMLPDGLFLN